MKKIFVTSVFVIVLLMISVVLASDHELSNDLEEFIKKVAEKRGIDVSEIQNITEVNFSNTPSEIKLENIDDASLSIYEISQTGNQSTFVITFSSESFQQISKPSSSYTTSFLTFGLSKENDKSSFMETASGIQTFWDSDRFRFRVCNDEKWKHHGNFNKFRNY